MKANWRPVRNSAASGRLRADVQNRGCVRERACRIKLVLSDCDGVLTDGGVYYSDMGETLKRFNIRDGMGVERLRILAGIESGIVSGERSPSLRKRAEKLGMTECHLGAKDKAAMVQSILDRRGLTRQEVAYIGDDVNDLPAFAMAGLSACPADAENEVKAAADVVLVRLGGQGAFREFAEIFLPRWVLRFEAFLQPDSTTVGNADSVCFLSGTVTAPYTPLSQDNDAVKTRPLELMGKSDVNEAAALQGGFSTILAAQFFFALG